MVMQGTFKLLPLQWILSIITTVNTLFLSCNHPSMWKLARLVTIFKHGDRSVPAYYMRVVIMNVSAKLCMELCNCIIQWFKPYRAGRQPT